MAIVVTRAVKQAVNAVLDPFTERIGQDCRDYDCQHQTRGARTRQAAVDEHASEGHDGKIRTGNSNRSQCIGHATLEDQVHVHQFVAEDGVAERQRQEAERENGRVKHWPPKHKRNCVQQRERSDSQDCAARQPLELVTENWAGGRVVAAQQNGGSSHEINNDVGHQ